MVALSQIFFKVYKKCYKSYHTDDKRH